MCVFSSCEGSTNSESKIGISKDIDYQILRNEAKLRKVYDIAVQKMGDDIKYVEKLDINISRPSERGRVGMMLCKL